MSTFPLPLHGRPVVSVAARLVLRARDFAPVHRSPTHAVHLHEYHATFRMGGRDYRVTPGTLTFSPAGLESSYDLPRPGMHWVIHYAQPDHAGPARSAALPLVQHLGARQVAGAARFAHVMRLWNLLSRATPDEVPVIEAAASTACQELLLWAATLGMADEHGGAAACDAALDELIEFVGRYLDRPLRVPLLAARAGLSQNYLARVFRRRTGSTLPAYILSRRITAARLLLSTTHLPIKQIAQRVGLPDLHHFNKQFRSATGVSPSAYRRESGHRPNP
jgi:AraC-like DNA-binding protein